MLKVTQTQRDNLLIAKTMWNSVPEKNVIPRLRTWRKNDSSPANSAPTCNTVACFGGWCIWYPEFQAQGLSANESGYPTLNGESSASYVSFTLFGITDMFVSREWHDFDKHLSDMDSDHAVVMNRINRTLENSIVTS